MNEKLKAQIQQAVSRLSPEIIEFRRDIHMHPELSFQESRTSEKIKSYLQAKGIAFEPGWATHGLVATIEGAKSGPRRMLRADMDALPIQETSEVPYRSVHPGIMHACGHDVHSATLLGVAALVQEHRSELAGTLQMIFQPGEEKLPGGASIMIGEGVLKKYSPEWIAALHVFPALPAGHVGFRNGLYMASADEIYITVVGRGGHAATPSACIDPIPIAARMVSSLQEIISRNLDPILPGVLTIGKIYSDGGATNVIPDRVFLEGTLRAMDEDWRVKTHHRIKQLAEDLCRASGANAEVRIETGYPSLKNDDGVTDFFRQKAIEYLGADKVHDLPLRLTSEDFAFYSQQIPATFYRLGTGFPDRENPAVHSSQLLINESALETGMGLMSYAILS